MVNVENKYKERIFKITDFFYEKYKTIDNFFKILYKVFLYFIGCSVVLIIIKILYVKNLNNFKLFNSKQIKKKDKRFEKHDEKNNNHMIKIIV